MGCQPSCGGAEAWGGEQPFMRDDVNRGVRRHVVLKGRRSCRPVGRSRSQGLMNPNRNDYRGSLSCSRSRPSRPALPHSPRASNVDAGGHSKRRPIRRIELHLLFK